MTYLEFCSNCGLKNSFGEIDGNRRFHCRHCKTIHYENPKPTATLICPKGNKLLLVKRAVEPAKGQWGLPGGFIERNETPEEGAIRELMEETHLVGRPIKLLGHCSHQNTIFGDVLLLGILMEIKDWSNLTPDDDAERVDLFLLDNLPPLAFPCHEKIIELFLRLQLSD